MKEDMKSIWKYIFEKKIEHKDIVEKNYLKHIGKQEHLELSVETISKLFSIFHYGSDTKYVEK
jgi:hypothetical protein